MDVRQYTSLYIGDATKSTPKFIKNLLRSKEGSNINLGVDLLPVSVIYSQTKLALIMNNYIYEFNRKDNKLSMLNNGTPVTEQKIIDLITKYKAD